MPTTGRVTDSVEGSGNASPRVDRIGFARGIEVGAVAGFLNDGERAIDGGRILVRLNTRRSKANLFDVQSFACQRLAYPAYACAAVHPVNPQCEFRHSLSPVWIDDSCRGKMQSVSQLTERLDLARTRETAGLSAWCRERGSTRSAPCPWRRSNAAARTQCVHRRAVVCDTGWFRPCWTLLPPTCRAVRARSR